MQIKQIKRKYYFNTLKFFAFNFLIFSSVVLIQGQKIPPPFRPDADNTTKGTPTEYLQLIEAYNNEELKNSALAKQLRNKLIFETVDQLKASSDNYKKGKINRNKWLQTIFDVLEIGAATAISIMNGERAKTVTADALSGLQAGRTALNKDLKLLEIEAAFNKLKALQADKLSLVYARLDEDVVEFSWKDAKSMLRDYLNLDINDAIAGISDTANNEKIAAEARADMLKKAGISIGVTKAQYDLSAKNFVAIRAIIREFPADAPVGAAPAVVSSVEKKRDEVIAKLRSMYDLIVSIPKLNKILTAIPDDSRLSPGAKAIYQTSLANLTANNYMDKKLALSDYERILLAFNRGVTAKLVEDPKLAEEVGKIIP